MLLQEGYTGRPRGWGWWGARRLMDVCEISSRRENGTNVLMKKSAEGGPETGSERIRELADLDQSDRKARSKKSSSRTANCCACSTNCGGGRPT